MSDFIESIARVCHEANRALCNAFGDLSQPTWEEAPAWQRDSAIAGVKFHLANPTAGPEASHNSWLEQKRADGWTYGEVKDPVAKTHPCFRPYEELPTEQKAKDYIFRAIVHAHAKPSPCSIHFEEDPEVPGQMNVGIKFYPDITKDENGEFKPLPVQQYGWQMAQQIMKDLQRAEVEGDGE